MRPEIISKLAMFLIDKEPLVYLFIINTDFIPREGLYEAGAYAAVSYKNKRVQFSYDPKIWDKMPAEEIYYLILHEAEHIFKKHLDTERWEKSLDPFFLNLAMDSIIDDELNSMDVSYNLIPKMPFGMATIPDEFKFEYHENNYTTKRLYYWYIEKAKQNFEKKLFRVSQYVHVKGTQDYGRIDEILEKKRYRVVIMNKDQVIEDYKKKEMLKKLQDPKQVFKQNQLIPIVFGDDAFHGEGIEDWTIGKLPETQDDKIEVEIFTRKLLQQAQEIEKKLPHVAGDGLGSFTRKIEKILEPKVNWKTILNKHINLYLSKTSSQKGAKLSYINYLRNPKSNRGILFRYPIETINKLQTYIILAVDTSGSIFYSEQEFEIFFSEIEEMAKWMKFSKSGSILTLQWSTEILEGLTEYKENDWKKFAEGKRKILGGGGTTPEIVFDYFNKIFINKESSFHVVDGNIDFHVAKSGKLPLVIFLTDGYFFNSLCTKDLGIYENKRDSLLFFTRTIDHLYPDANSIIYS